jgi:16S rRNA (guanine966-N2)-methyltransferase
MALVNKNSGKLRLIAGRLRGHPLTFNPESNIRPTSDRVRETLFNWLSPYIQGASCLDLFSGSGALGFEAFSRGAKHVLMCEKDYKTYRDLEINRDSLSAEACEIRHVSFEPAMPSLASRPFDIVFLDPPYKQALITESLTWLVETKSIHEESVIYFEMEKVYEDNVLFDAHKPFRMKSTSSLTYGLFSGDELL